MCVFETSSKILRGLDGIRFFSLLLTLLTTFACNTRVADSDTSTIRRITETGRLSEMRRSLEREPDRVEVFNNEDVFVGPSGNPWGSPIKSVNLKKLEIRLQSFTSSGRTSNSSTAGNSVHKRPKRNIAHLYSMITCASPCSPLSYKGYGCYCGFLGSGTAVDGIDMCCKIHDHCYDKTYCWAILQYLAPYYWDCYRGYIPICATYQVSLGGYTSCARHLCECDRKLAMCLQRYPCPKSKAVCTTSPWRLAQNIFMIL